MFYFSISSLRVINIFRLVYRLGESSEMDGVSRENELLLPTLLF